MIQRLFILFPLFLFSATAQKFFPDDPLEHDLKPLWVKEAANRKLSDYYDLLRHTFGTPGELNRSLARPNPAQGVNTLGEPLQGAWWVKRHYYKAMSPHAMVDGPGTERPPSMGGPWTVVGAKNEGVTPGFLMYDQQKRLYFIKFDPSTNPEIATAADHVSNRLLYALGYHVPENYLVEFTSEQLVLGKDVKIADRLGRRRPMTQRDLNEMLLKVHKTGRGLFRATASLAIVGSGIGPYRYYGTRSDDPNDYVPHEHRRDLRGLSVVAAWIDHDDSRAINTYDALAEEGGEKVVRHYILDLGSALGSGTQKANSARSGGEYLFGWKQSARQLFSLGLAVPPWARSKFPDLPSVGRFEYERFDPETWVPEYPNPAFLNRLPDDEFWAAKQIMAIGDADIKAIVASARYSDPKAESWIVECLIQRRNKIGRAYYRKVLPLDRFKILDGKLTYEDLADSAGFGPAGPYGIQWFQLDNLSGSLAELRGSIGPVVPTGGGEFRVARITTHQRPSQSVDVTVRLNASQPPEIVGVERIW